jgi:hypothetical protein
MTATTASLRPPTVALFDQSPALTRHLQQCHAARGRLFQAAAWAELAHGLVAPRFVSTVSVAAVLLLACTW